MSAIEHEVKVVIAGKLGLTEDEIDGDASVVDDLRCRLPRSGGDGHCLEDKGGDGHCLEDKFDLDIPDEDAKGISTVRQAVEYINHSLETRP